MASKSLLTERFWGSSLVTFYSTKVDVDSKITWRYLVIDFVCINVCTCSTKSLKGLHSYLFTGEPTINSIIHMSNPLQTVQRPPPCSNRVSFVLRRKQNRQSVLAYIILDVLVDGI